MFASRGVDVPRLFEAAGLDIKQLDHPDARFDVDLVSRLWELAVAWTQDETLGLNKELPLRYFNFDVVGYAMLSCATLYNGLDTLSKYMSLISDAATFELTSDPRGYWLELGNIGNNAPVPRQRQEYGMLSLLTLCEWLVHKDITPLQAEFAFPQPTSAVPYEKAFSCPLAFNKPITRVLLSASDFALEIPTQNVELFEMHKSVMTKRLDALKDATLSMQVVKEIMRQLHKGEPRREDIAGSLAMSDRTLQRRLNDENTSYQMLLDQARMELAAKYLADKAHSLDRIAGMLGFVETPNFSRACKRWFGMPPGQYRQEKLKV